MKKSIYIIILFVLMIACNNKEQNDTSNIKTNSIISYEIEIASAWNDMFWRSEGWFGGDGMFCVNLNGRENIDNNNPKILMWFSDSMFGEIISGNLESKPIMTNNSFGITNKNVPGSGVIKFYPEYVKGKTPKTLLVPNSPNSQKDEYYWLGDGFVNDSMNNNLYIFGYRIKTLSDEAFDFKEVGNNLIVIPSQSIPDFNKNRQIDIPFFKDIPIDSVVMFGCAVLPNTEFAGLNKGDGYIYVYGVKGEKKEIFVARMLPEEIEDFDKWLFWNGSKFTKSLSDIKPLFKNASNEISISTLPNGKYIFVYQKGFNGKICYRLADSPVGPFKKSVDIYDPAIEIKKNKNYYSYNAKAHPVLSKPNELLISYHVNSFTFFEDIKNDPHLYSPRFIRLKFTFN